ncbi:hypothetical protein Bbelb_380400 [Branchiostoma belcheri]|nr:hypothetical protein Bbelb_380400 [Branchiostoma belcheri]
MDGSSTRTLLTSPAVSRPKRLVLDPRNGLMYWADDGNNRIARAAMDGSNPTTIITGVSNPIAVTIDYREDRLYYSDGSRMYSSDLLGNDIQQLLYESGKTVRGIAVDENYVYWLSTWSHPSRQGNVVHKRDSKSNPSMYRPISLLSNISKVMEAVVQTELQKYLLQNNIISDRQFGFRPHHSTADILTILSQHWSNALDNGYEVCLIALDIKGAFDKVWHNGLCSKLRSKGVCGKLLTWIDSYLSDRSIKVVLSGQSSTTTSINACVPQGSILGPLLFSVFIDDVGDGCESPTYLYADDSTLYCVFRTSDDRVSAVMSLNRDLERMRIWAEKWKVTFEPTKCKTMTISRKRSRARSDLFFGNTKLAEKDELEILGVTIDNKLSWTKHTLNTAARAGQKLGAMRRVAHKLTPSGRAAVYKAHHRRQVAAAALLYKMHTDSCPAGLKTMLPKPYTLRRTTRTSLAMPTHALAQPVSRTSSTGRTFIHSGVQIWNQLPDSIVGNINNNGLQSFKPLPRETLFRTPSLPVRHRPSPLSKSDLTKTVLVDGLVWPIGIYLSTAAPPGVTTECNSLCQDVSSAGSRVCTGPAPDQCHACSYRSADGTCTSGCNPGQKAVPGTSDGTFICQACRSGYRCVNGDQVDEICPAGTYSNAEGTACDPCPAGQYSGSAGSTSCTICPAGRFSARAESTSCTVCPADTFSSSAGSTSCQQCPAGTGSTTGSTSCSGCSKSYVAHSNTISLPTPARTPTYSRLLHGLHVANLVTWDSLPKANYVGDLGATSGPRGAVGMTHQCVDTLCHPPTLVPAMGQIVEDDHYLWRKGVQLW